MNISIIIPLYNEAESLHELHHRIKETCIGIGVSYEIIFVDDGSTDNSFSILKSLHEENEEVKVISFRKNYGKSAALSEGFRMAKGDIVITMDADLQDDPGEIRNLLDKISSGDDLVSGWKKKRHDPIQKTIPSKFFNFTTSLLTGIKIHDFNCGIKAYRSEVIKEIPVYGELHRYLPVLAHWQGFKIGEIVVEHHSRKYGKTKFGVGRFFKGFFDLLTVLFLTRYRQRPLHLFGFLGLLSLFLGIIISIYLTIIWFQGYGIGQRPLLFLGILLIIVGLQSFSIGLIGEMIASTRKNKQSYKIKELLK